MSISFTTIVLNEAKHVEDLVKSVADIVDEFVFVDTGSTDGTPQVLERLGCTVLRTTLRPNSGGFATARNLGLEACKGEWILSLDADERPNDKFARWVDVFVAKAASSYGSTVFARDNYLDGKLISEELHRRLFRREDGAWQGVIHESVQCRGRTYEAPKSVRILHHKTKADQRRQNQRYLEFYPKLNLGSGGVPMDPEHGWINYDLDTRAPLSTKADVFEELPTSLPASYILASHILEHVSYHRAAKDVLSMWIAKLAPGGVIEIRVPDLAKIVRQYVAGNLDYLRFIQLMYGGQTSKYDFHCHAVDQSWLTGQFTWWGLEDIHRQHPTSEYELRMSARKPL